MAQIITVCFERREVMDWGLNRFAEAARRCNVEAARQPDQITASALRRLAKQYRDRAAEGAR